MPALAGAALLFGVQSGCRCEHERASEERSTASGVAVGCVRGAEQLTLSPSDGAAIVGDPEAVDQPFSVEVGVAAVLGSDFWVTALRSEVARAEPLLARLGATTVTRELGALSRAEAPPRVAASADELVLGVSERVGSERRLRLAHATASGGAAPPTWSVGLGQGGDESSAFDLALEGDRVLVVWDDEGAGGTRSRVWSASVALGALDAPSEPQALSRASHHAESPRLAPRPGGYWAAWIAEAPQPAAEPQRAPRSEHEGVRAAPSPERWVEIVAVDGDGAPRGSPRRVSKRSRKVLGFDLASGPNGDAWLAWREDAASVLAAGGRIALARVTDGGAVAEHLLHDDDDVGAGVPAWLAAAAGAQGEPVRWLSWSDRADRARLAEIDASGRARGELIVEGELGDASALAVRGSEVLFARPRGRSMELSIATCTFARDAGAP